MQNWKNLGGACVVFLAAAAMAVAQPPSGFPGSSPDPKTEKKADEPGDLLKISAEMSELKRRLIEMGKPDAFKHTPFLFSVHMRGTKVGRLWMEDAEKAAKARFKDDDKLKGKATMVAELQGVTFSAWRPSGEVFTVAVYHVKDTAGREWALSTKVEKDPEVTRATVMMFLTLLDESAVIDAAKAVEIKVGPKGGMDPAPMPIPKKKDD